MRHQNMSVVHAAHSGIDVLIVQSLLQRVVGLIGALADGFIHLHLQDEMAAAAKVEPEMNAVGKVLPDLPEGGGEWNADESKNTNENYKQR